MTGKLHIQFLQQPEDGQNFKYTINSDGSPLIYDSGLDLVDKTFGEANFLKQDRFRITRVNQDLMDDTTFLTGTTGFDYSVKDIKELPNGDIIVVGHFNNYAGSVEGKITKLNADGTNETFSSDFGYADSTWVNTVCIDNVTSPGFSRLFVGGNFTLNTSSPKYNIVAFDPSGSLVPAASGGFIQGAGYNNEVTKIKMHTDGDLIVGGGFRLYNNLKNAFINKISTGGQRDNAFTSNQGNGLDNWVRDFHIHTDGKIMVGGDFRKFNDGQVNCIVRLNANGTRDFSFNGLGSGFPLGSFVWCVAFDEVNQQYYFGGSFSQYNDVSRKFLVRTDIYGAIDTSFDLGLNGMVKDIRISGETVTIAGDFTSANGEIANRIVRVDLDGNTVSDAGLGFNAPVNVIEPTDSDDFYVGGEFTGIITQVTTPYDIPIGPTMTATKINTYNNLITYNTNPNINYVINGDVIDVYYVSNTDITYTDIQEIEDYVHIYYDLSNEDSSISVLSRPMDLMPVYNPIIFKFGSANYGQEQFKYIVDVKNSSTGAQIARFKVRPIVDGTGYLDISKILSSYVSVDFDPSQTINNDATKSYINYSVDFGEEYLKYWNFDSSEQYDVSGLFENSVVLSSLDHSHNFLVGDFINITASDSSSTVNGLHEVLAVPNLTSIVIDAVYNDETIDGSAVFADNRNTAFIATATVSGLTAFNGAMSFKDFRHFQSSDYIVRQSDIISTGLTTSFLTNLPDDKFYVTPTQDIWLDYAVLIDNAETFNQTKEISLCWATNDNQFGVNLLSDQSTDDKIIVRQVNVSPSVLGITGTPEWYAFFLLNGAAIASEGKRIYLDHRCKIEPYEIAFMDRMGSIASYAFQLRASEKGQITRDMYKSHFDISQTEDAISYNTYDRGSNINHVDVTKSLELNTNWMTDVMGQYFEELLTSPFTWIKIDGEYYACIIEDKEFETVKQANQTIIRRSVKITLANQDSINI